MANASGSFTGFFANFLNNNVSKFKVDSSGNTTMAGTLTIVNGANTVYRCTVAGALPIGALTINTANCGTWQDTGLRVQ